MRIKPTTLTPSFVTIGLSLFIAVSPAWGVTPFSEGFDSDDSNWLDVNSASPNYFNAGGNPGGYISDTIVLDDQTGTLFRGHDEFNASNSAFVGDWKGMGINRISFDVRHNNPGPLNFFARIATPGNFPAQIALGFAPVFPNTWTTVSVDILEGSPALISEFGSYDDTFTGVGHIQIGTEVDPNTPPQTVTFDLDNVSIVPEPTAVVTLLGGLLLLLLCVRIGPRAN